MPTDLTAENWPALHSLFMETTSANMKLNGGDRAQAMIDAAGEMGAMFDPPLTSLEFRQWDGTMLNAAKKTNHKSNGHTPALAPTKRGGLVDDRLKEIFPASEPASDKPLPLRDRADLLLRGMKKGETRWEVCIDQAMARSVQTHIGYAAKRAGWRRGGYASSVLPDTVHQAGEKRLLLVVKRL